MRVYDGFAKPKLKVSLRVLAGPDGVSHIAYDVGPSGHPIIADRGAGLKTVQRLRNYLTSLGA